jgi:hypothetical protein
VSPVGDRGSRPAVVGVAADSADGAADALFSDAVELSSDDDELSSEDNEQSQSGFPEGCTVANGLANSSSCGAA